MTSNPHLNYLAEEKSPFLLQHANDLVSWYPWGETAFSLAKDQDQPIFMCIGHEGSTDCSRMRSDIFLNSVIADKLNRSFVCILVDKDQYPSVANLYQEFARAFFLEDLSLPLVFALSPTLYPVYVARHLPLHSHNEEVGVKEFIEKVQDLWENHRDVITRETALLVEELKSKVLSVGEKEPKRSLLAYFKEQLFPLVNPLYGGENGLPKRMNTGQMHLLMNLLSEEHDDRSILYVTRTLDRLYYSSMCDHAGGGFFRESQKEDWSEPKLEKQLGENACILSVYLKAWKLFKTNEYRQIVVQSLRYFLKHFKTESGGYSAYDADIEGAGKAFFWKYKDLSHLIGEEKTSVFAPFLSVYEEALQPLHPSQSIDDYCYIRDLDVSQFSKQLSEVLAVIRKSREKKKTSENFTSVNLMDNALFADVLIKSGFSLDALDFVERGVELLEFLWQKFWHAGQLGCQLQTKDSSQENAFAAYAYFIKSLITAYELGLGVTYLDRAKVLAKAATHFFKEDEGAFFQVGTEVPHLLFRQCDFLDTELPSPNATHAENLYRLYLILDSEDELHYSQDIFKAAKPLMEFYPTGCSYLYDAFWFMQTKLKIRIEIIEGNTAVEHLKVQTQLAKHYLPFASVRWVKSPAKARVWYLDKNYSQDFTMESLEMILKEIQGE